MTFLPLVVPVSTLPRTASQRRQLLHIMTELRSQYQYWLTHPNLPFAEITPHPPLVGRRSPYTPFLTNLGVIDRYIPEALPMGSEVPSVHVHELRFGHRIAHFHRPYVLPHSSIMPLSDESADEHQVHSPVEFSVAVVYAYAGPFLLASQCDPFANRCRAVIRHLRHRLPVGVSGPHNISSYEDSRIRVDLDRASQM